MRIVRANASWAARVIFAAIGAAGLSAVMLCLEATRAGAGFRLPL